MHAASELGVELSLRVPFHSLTERGLLRSAGLETHGYRQKVLLNPTPRDICNSACRNFCLGKSPSHSHRSYEIKPQKIWSVEILCKALSGYDIVLLSSLKLSSLIHDDRTRSFYREKACSFSRPSLATSQMSVVVCPVNWLYGCSLCGLAIIMSINPVTGNEIWCIRGLSGLFLRVWPCALVTGLRWTLLSSLTWCRSNYFWRKRLGSSFVNGIPPNSGHLMVSRF